MKIKENLFLIDIVLRYLLIFLLGLGNLYLFYFIFTPITINLLYFILNIFTEATLINNSLLVKSVSFEIVSACVGGFAYYLLFILIFSTREIKLLKRIKILLILYGLLFFFNIARILFMVYIYGFVYFDTIHWFFWYFISTFFVFMLWVIAVSLFKIKNIPIYSDLTSILSSFRIKKKSSSRKKSKRKN
jgi:exosortase/archaeosortase family protein